MTPELLGEAIVDFAFLAVFLGVLGIGALIADYVFPHIPFIQRYLDRLPDYEDDKEVEPSVQRRTASETACPSAAQSKQTVRRF